MSAAPLRIGLAGANAERGWAKDAHLGAINALPDLVVHAVSARTQDIADGAMAMFGAAKAYDDSLELTRDPDVDIVAVTVKVPEHRAIVLAAIAAGKHVYCEWPLGRDLAEAKEMADAARKAGVHVAIGLQGANSWAVRHAAQLVKDGVIGRPLSLRVVSPTGGWGAVSPPNYAYLQDKANGATLSTIAGGHTLAAIEAIIGSFTEVSARASILRDEMTLMGSNEVVKRTCADHLLTFGKHESGCISSLEVVGGVVDVPFQFELRGTNGTLSINGGHPGGYQVGPLTVTTTPESAAQLPATVSNVVQPSINVAEVWARFAKDIRSGSRTVPDFDRAVRLTRLLDAIDESSERGQVIAL
ncbi:Gfo/Idh/MocA family oxidoreductase [Novosphingobium sp. MMS21-SN21R]|uniref:Gfo/Idh/MocA family protein n=1 Tax=Novosphingobium sp. MMS21-SN21R TaxID=2969298 RepID=UPI0028845CD7|nr:Gfo/Idh/MocA family oxidoreductase [Novosphingobium sp. MMS21-SN21R]MDT0509798.1 Gfo/Idh/MocA family oxidoreductase [Novosphingobium sp. MMS21-SN21R]